MKKARLIPVIFLLISSLLTACGNEETELTQNIFEEDFQGDPQEVIIAAVEHPVNQFGELEKLKAFIWQFNESQSRYVVRLETTMAELSTNIDGNTMTTSDDIANAAQRLNIDLVTGIGGYDLLWLDDFTLPNIDVQGMLKAGVFEDLGSWLDKKGGLERDDFFNMVLSAYNLDGTIFALPAEVQVRCLSGNTDLLDNRTEWTLREFLDFAAEYPDMRIYNCDIAPYAVLTLFQEGNISFAQEDENRQLIFDDELLSDLLVYGKTAPFRQGVRGIKGVTVSLTASQDYRYLDTDPKTFIGFPSQDGQNGCIIENLRSLSICSNSDCKEGAWAFLEYYLLHNEDNRNNENSYYRNHETYPAVKEIFERNMAEQLYSQWERDENGEILLDEQGEPMLRVRSYSNNGFLYPPITEEDVAFVRDFLLSSRGSHLQLFSTNQLCVILSEECIPYFMDQKTLEEAVEIIRGRMLPYYQEHMD